MWQTGPPVCVGRASATGEADPARYAPRWTWTSAAAFGCPYDAPDLWQGGEATTMNILDSIDAASLRDDIPPFRPGDTIKVNVKVVEGNRSRIQAFQGVVIARNGGGVRETFTVRKISFGVGVERTFPLHAPTVDSIEVVTRGDVRRAKLYYLRSLRGKKAKIKEKR